jgi:hypothetical protein
LNLRRLFGSSPLRWLDFICGTVRESFDSKLNRASFCLQINFLNVRILLLVVLSFIEDINSTSWRWLTIILLRWNNSNVFRERFTLLTRLLYNILIEVSLRESERAIIKH